MAGRKKKASKQKQKGGEEGGEEQQQAKGQQHHGENLPDPPAAVMALHPDGSTLAVAVGEELRVYDSRLKEVKTLRRRPEGQGAGAAGRLFVRALAFDATGSYLAAASDDKSQGMLLWDAATWDQLLALKVPKRASAVALTQDGAYVLAADKFGDVHVAPTRPASGKAPAAPELLLGHFCSILTSLTPSPDGRFVVSTDRDGKARVSVLPADPLQGAHEIQSFCLGHTDAVTASAFVASGGKELLVTGGADSTVRLWDHVQGALLSTIDLQQAQQQGQEQQQAQQRQQEEQQAAAGGEGAAKAEGAQDTGAGEAAAAEGPEAGDGEQGEEEEEDDRPPAVLSVAGSPDGRWVAAAVEGRDDEVLLLRVDWEARALREAGWRRLEGLHMPSQLAFGPGNRLWAVGGPPTEESVSAFLACATISEEGEAAAGPAEADGGLPAAALVALEAKDGTEVAALAAAAEARRRRAGRMDALVRRRRYPGEEERRKRQRREAGVQEAAAGQEAQPQAQA